MSQRLIQMYVQTLDFINCAFSYVDGEMGEGSDLDSNSITVAGKIASLATMLKKRNAGIQVVDGPMAVRFLQQLLEADFGTAVILRAVTSAIRNGNHDSALAALMVDLSWASGEFIRCLLQNIPGLAKHYLANTTESAAAQELVCDLFEEAIFSDKVKTNCPGRTP